MTNFFALVQGLSKCLAITTVYRHVLPLLLDTIHAGIFCSIFVLFHCISIHSMLVVMHSLENTALVILCDTE